MSEFLAWELAYPIGGLLLLAALAYGAWRYHSRDRRNDPVSDEAARELYDHPDTYDQRKQGLDCQIKPDQ